MYVHIQAMRDCLDTRAYAHARVHKRVHMWVRARTLHQVQRTLDDFTYVFQMAMIGRSSHRACMPNESSSRVACGHLALIIIDLSFLKLGT